MERRVLIALFLSFLVLFAYQTFFSSTPTKPQTVTSGTPVAGAQGGVSVVNQSDATPPPAAVVGGDAETEVKVETPHVVATFTNRGARLKSWRLKEYRDPSGNPLELVDATLNGQPLPFSLTLPDAPTTSLLNSVLFAVKQSGEQVEFEYRNEAGLNVSKVFTLNPASYTIDVQVRVLQNGGPVVPTIQWGPGLGDRDSQTGRYAVKPEVLFSSEGSVSRVASGKIAATPNYNQNFDYVGIDDHYFAVFAVKLKDGGVV